MFDSKTWTNIADVQGPDHVKVRQISLKDLAAEAGTFDVLKVDSEGAEWDVFSDEHALATLGYPRIFLELHTGFMRAGGRKPERPVLDLLRSGYEVRTNGPTGPLLCADWSASDSDIAARSWIWAERPAAQVGAGVGKLKLVAMAVRRPGGLNAGFELLKARTGECTTGPNALMTRMAEVDAHTEARIAVLLKRVLDLEVGADPRLDAPTTETGELAWPLSARGQRADDHSKPSALQRSWERLEGWCSLRKADELVRLVLENKVHCAVEVGVYGGRSLVPIGAALKSTGGVAFGIDAWSNTVAVRSADRPEDRTWWSEVDLRPIKAALLRFIADHALSEQLRLVELDSAAAFAAFSSMGTNPIDLLHIDGGHSGDRALSDVVTWGSLVRPGGIIVVDDLYLPALQSALARLREVATPLAEIVEGPEASFGVYRVGKP